MKTRKLEVFIIDYYYYYFLLKPRESNKKLNVTIKMCLHFNVEMKSKSVTYIQL